MREHQPITAGTHQTRSSRPAPWLLALIAVLACALGLAATTGTVNAATVAAAGDQTCATKDGGVWCWGYSWYGLGDGTTDESSTPVRVAGLTTADAVTAGADHACARRTDRTLWCWGSNGYGELGNGTTDDAATPVQVAGIGDATGVAVGDGYSCAVRAGGQVACWGNNRDDQLGGGTAASESTTPVGVPGIGDAVAIAIGNPSSNDGHRCVLRASGHVSCWGDNWNGQLGDGTTSSSATPMAVVGLDDAVAIATGSDHSCAIRRGGSVACWGGNGDGQLGDGSRDRRLTPVPVSGITGAVSLSLGSDATCAVLGSGDTRCWGTNDRGQLGTSTADERSILPIAVPGATAATEVAAGSGHVCVRGATATVQCWGNGAEGQLGNGKTVDAPHPTTVAGLHDTATVAVGDEFSCALRAAGTVDCWGRNRYGQLGAGLNASFAASPVPVVGVSAATMIAAGGNDDGTGLHACALHGTGSAASRQISCWGSDWIGQLGTGGAQPRIETNRAPVATDVAAILASYPNSANFRFTTLTAGNTFTCALVVNGSNDSGDVWCWGRGGSGQLGEGQTVNRYAPVKVTRPTGFAPAARQDQGPTLAAGSGHVCAISSIGNRTVWCWGANSSGQIGDGQTANRTTPKQVVGLSSIASVASGRYHSCALRTNGTVACWGSGSRGQLGHGQTPGSSTPVDVPSVTGAVALAAGGDQTCATLADGTLTCWGARFDGRFSGGQNTADRTTPSPVAGVSGPRTVALGTKHSCFTTAAGTAQCWGSSPYGQLGDGPMPGGHFPIQRAPTYVIGFEPPAVPPIGDPPGAPPFVAPGPRADPTPVLPVAPKPVRPKPLTVELRDGTLSLRALTLKRAKKAKTCPKTAKATVSARVTVRSGKRKSVRTVKTTRTIKLKKTKTACQTTAAVKLKGQSAKATKVALTITGKGLTTSKRTVKARFSTTLQTTALKLDRLVVRSTHKDVCPARATVTVTGATTATRKHRATKRSVPIRLAPTAHCRVSTTVKLPTKLRRAKAVTVTVQGSGLTTTKRTVRVG